MIRLTVVAILLTAAGGCTLDLGGGDDQCLTPVATGSDALAPLPELLDPATLRCESFGGGGCNPACGPCPPAEPIPTWAYCYGECDGLDEWTCRAATACRATYDEACYTGNGACTLVDAYLGCHGTDMTGPVEGSCSGLDAFECSRHNDCIALHTPQCSGDTTDCWQQFVECLDDATCYGEVVCLRPAPACDDASIPAVKNGCYTGDCIPLGQCEPAPPPPPA